MDYRDYVLKKSGDYYGTFAKHANLEGVPVQPQTGKPMTVTAYHGTKSEPFYQFETPHGFPPGFFFSSVYDVAHRYAHMPGGIDNNGKPRVIRAEIDFNNPFVVPDDELIESYQMQIPDLIQQGYDGLVKLHPKSRTLQGLVPSHEFAAFHPHQITIYDHDYQHPDYANVAKSEELEKGLQYGMLGAPNQRTPTTRVRFVHTEHPPDFYHPSGEIEAIDLDGKVVGGLSYHRSESRPDMLHIASIALDPSYQGDGIGSEMLDHLHRVIHEKHPRRFKYVSADTTSQGSLRHITRHFGNPLYLTDGIKTLKPETAAGMLPGKGVVDTHGYIEGAGLTGIYPFGPKLGAAPKRHPWAADMKAAKSEDNLSFVAEEFAPEEQVVVMFGFEGEVQRAFDAARYLVNGNELPFEEVRKCLRMYDEDVEGAALLAYQIHDDVNSRRALRKALTTRDLAKGGHPVSVEHFQVTPGHRDALEVANAVQRGIDYGQINAVKLNGKHSKGAMVVKDPADGKVYLLKPGSGAPSPAAGVTEEGATQSEREAAFYHVAEYAGLGGTFPRADLVLVNGHQTAVMELLPVSYRNLGQRKAEEPNSPRKILEPYRQNATLFKWAALDYILGNPDRHSQNIMVDKDDRKAMLIDHGSALAGPSFDPANDDDSYIPYYLRAWTGLKFTRLAPEERLKFMPSLNEEGDRILEEWLRSLDPDRIEAILHSYHVNPDASLARLAHIRALPGPRWKAINRLWAGAI